MRKGFIIVIVALVTLSMFSMTTTEWHKSVEEDESQFFLVSNTINSAERRFLTDLKFEEITATHIEKFHKVIDARKAQPDSHREMRTEYPVIDGHGTGFKFPTERELSNLKGKKMIVGIKNKVIKEISSVRWDLDPHFPPVGNQGTQGSCVAWAVSYYQNGFLQRRIYNWTDDLPSHLMSPAWTYNKVNGGGDHGSNFESNAEVIKTIGDATWSNMSYRPFDYISWGNESAWRDAPKHRIGDYYIIYFGNDSGIDTLKEMLREGYLVTFAIDAYEYGRGFNDGNYIISSQEYQSIFSNHGQTIVGYDDSIEDDGDVGAFRVVNSWGTDFGDHGFYWLTYKAMKEKVSQSWPYAYVLIPKFTEPYNPRLLAVWHFSEPGGRDAPINITFGSEDSELYRTAYLQGGNQRFPYFMALDVSEFYDAWVDSGYSDRFYLKIGERSSPSVISSFRIEYYPYGYKLLWQESDESPDVPGTTPAVLASSPISPSDKAPFLHMILSGDILHRYADSNKTKIIVGNAGSMKDAFILSADISGEWSVRLSDTKVVLSPNETYGVDVIVDPPESAGMGIDAQLVISAVSENYSSVSYTLRVAVIYTSKPIYVDGDDSLTQQASKYGWPGDGSKENPYRISGLYIYREDTPGVYLYSTTLYIHIKDSVIDSALFGLSLYEMYHARFSNLTITHSLGFAMYALGSEYNIVENSRVYNNRGGMRLLSSNNNILRNNTVHSNRCGISLIVSDNTTLKDNTLYDNNMKGIDIIFSLKNRIYNNSLRNSGIVLQGNFSTLATQVIPTNNTVNGKPVYYYNSGNMDNLSVPQNAGEVIAANVSYLKIGNLKIFNTSKAIIVAYSSDIFIENNTLYNNSQGIYMIYTKHGVIRNNSIYGNVEDGIFIDLYSRQSVIMDNEVHDNGFYGIFLWWFSHGARVENNSVYNNGDSGITFYYINSSIIRENRVWNNSEFGIFLNWDSCNNTIENNTVWNNREGIYLYWSYNDDMIRGNTVYHNRESGIHIVESANITMEENDVYDNNRSGVYIHASLNICVKNNSLHHNVWEGVVISTSSWCEVSDNEIYENQIAGMTIYSIGYPGENITVRNNHVHDNRITGISMGLVKNFAIVNNRVYNHGIETAISGGINLIDAQNGTVMGNTIHSNPIGIILERTEATIFSGNEIFQNDRYGMYLEFGATHNIIKNSFIHNNTNGIALENADNNTIAGNVISNCTTGIYFIYNSNENTIRNNNITNNSMYGIFISGRNSYNLVYNNTFYYNHGSGDTYNTSHVQAYDDGCCNHWNTTSGYGNYWHDWAKNNDTNDENGDGIVDWPYRLDGVIGAKDYYPQVSSSIPIPEFTPLLPTVISIAAFLEFIMWRRRH